MKECMIRADGNGKIGAGHLMRCLTIAKAMRDMRADREILFLCGDKQSAELVREYGFPVRVLDTDYQDMEAELPLLGELFQDRDKQRTILVDSYYVTDAYLEALKGFGRIVLLDDMQQHRYPVDIVINYNVFADKAIYEMLYQGSGTRLLVGSSYVPVREQFLHRQYMVADTVRNVLITTGGGDKDNIAGKILQELFQTPYSEKLNYHLIIGRYNPYFQELKQLEASENRVHIHYDVKDMAALMLSCDLAITAGGTTIYELAAMGVPFICFSYAENQEALTEYIGRKNIAGFAGAYHREPSTALEKIKRQFIEYCERVELRNTCYENERALIDGLGARRLAENIWKEA